LYASGAQTERAGEMATWVAPFRFQGGRKRGRLYEQGGEAALPLTKRSTVLEPLFAEQTEQPALPIEIG